MKYKRLLSFIFGLILFGCNYDTKSTPPAKTISKTAKINSETIKLPNDNKDKPNDDKDKNEIQALIRQMLKWADAKGSIRLLPVLSQDSICVGFDFDKKNQNLETLKKTGFFADEFIDNYNQIILTLDKKIKNKEFDKWNTYELPPFNFDNDVNPWCLCQDNLSWDNIEVKIIKLSNDKGELEWNWGKLDSDTDPSWKDFSYTFRVVKLDNKWKISYLKGFDYQESIK